MDLGKMILDFRKRTGDLVRPYAWPDEDLAEYFTDAEKEASIRSMLIRDTDELDIAAGDTVIDLPSGLFAIEFAELRDAAGNRYEIRGTDRGDLDARFPGWRTESNRPRNYVHDDKSLTLGYVADAAYTLYIEFYRTPRNALVSDSDVPEIAEIHHESLADWVEFKGYSIPDSDFMDKGRAAQAEQRFAAYFGKPPNANLRRRQNANRPHRNRLHG